MTMTEASLDPDRLSREKSFHDDRFSDDSSRAPTKKFYDGNQASFEYYYGRVSDITPPVNVLEYGCGTGSSAFELASRGATVTGIDISPVAIEVAEKEAASQGCSANTTFVEANAEDTQLPAGSFDLVCGSGILHHLDLERSMAELQRLLHPEGRAVFLEPLGHNPAINWYRNRTPEMRSVDEHPLLDTDLANMERQFHLQANYFGIATIAGGVTAKVPVVGSAVTQLLTKVDDRLLQIPAVQKYAWIVVLELRPR